MQNNIRIFLSSTFKDMQEERDYLVNKVFPALRVVAETRGIPFSWCDLRFGVSAFEEEYIVRLCLMNIENSNPSFVGLIGNSYGSVPRNLNKMQIKRLSAFRGVPSMLRKEMGYTETEMRYFITQYSNDESFDFYFIVGEENKFAKNGVMESLKCFFERHFPNLTFPFKKTEKVKLQSWKNYIIKNTRQTTSSYYWVHNEDRLLEDDKVYQTLRNAIEQRFPTTKFPKEELAWNEQQSYLHNILSRTIDDIIIIEDKDKINDRYKNRDFDILNLYYLGAFGKTFWAANQIKRSMADGVICFYHFVGGSRVIDTPITIWKSILYQVCKYLNRDYTQYSAINDRDSLRERLTDCLYQIEEKVLILIDGFGDDVSCSKEHRNTFIADFPDPKDNIQYIVTSNEEISQTSRVLSQCAYTPLVDFEKIENAYARNQYGYSEKDLVIPSSFHPIDFREAQYIVDELIIESIDKFSDKTPTDKNDIYACIKIRVENLISHSNKLFANRDISFFKGLKDAIMFLSLTKNGILESDVCKICDINAEQWTILYGYLSPFFKSMGCIKIVQPLAVKFYSECDLESVRLKFIENLIKHNADSCYTLEILFQTSQLKDKAKLLDILSDIDILNFVYDTDKDLLMEYLIAIENAQQLYEYHKKLLDSTCKTDQLDSFLFLYKIIDVFYDLFPRVTILQDYIDKADSYVEKCTIDTLKALDYYAKKTDIYISMGKFQEALEVLQLSEKFIGQKKGDYKQQHIQNLLLKAKWYDNYLRVPSERIKALDIYKELIEHYREDLKTDVLLDVIFKYVLRKEKGDDVVKYMKLSVSIFEDCSIIKKYSHTYFKTVFKYEINKLLLNNIQVGSEDGDVFFSQILSILEETTRMYPNSRFTIENMNVVLEFSLAWIKKLSLNFALETRERLQTMNLQKIKETNLHKLLEADLQKQKDNVLIINSWVESYVRYSKKLLYENSFDYIWAMINSSRHYQNMIAKMPSKKMEYLRASMECNKAAEKAFCRVFKDTNNVIIAKILNNRADIYLKLADYSNAMLCINSAIEIKEKIGMSKESLFKSKKIRIDILLDQIMHAEDLELMQNEISLCDDYIKELQYEITANEDLSESERKEREKMVEACRNLFYIAQTDERFFRVAYQKYAKCKVGQNLDNTSQKNDFNAYLEKHNLQLKFKEWIADNIVDILKQTIDRTIY